MCDFISLYNLNVNDQVEKKGKFTYLSWAFAVKELKKAYPEATYQQIYNETKPYFQDESGCYIRIKLWLTKDDRKQDFYQDFTHPVLDNNNKTISKPNSFQVNTSFMRGLTKLIAISTGLGLYIYAGEDLPEEADEPKKTDTKKETSQYKKDSKDIDSILKDPALLLEKVNNNENLRTEILNASAPIEKEDFEKIETNFKKLSAAIRAGVKNAEDFWNFTAKCQSKNSELANWKPYTDLVELYKPRLLVVDTPTKVNEYLKELDSVIGQSAAIVLPFAAKIESQRAGLADDLDWQEAKSKALVGKRAG